MVHLIRRTTPWLIAQIMSPANRCALPYLHLVALAFGQDNGR